MKIVITALALVVSYLSFAQDKYSPTTLRNFASAYSEIRVENNQMQLNMVSEIEKAGLTSDQFTSIHLKLKDASQSKSISREDKKKYDAAINNIEKFEKNTQKVFENIITQKGLTLETYQEISEACKEDDSLNEKVMSLVNK